MQTPLGGRRLRLVRHVRHCCAARTGHAADRVDDRHGDADDDGGGGGGGSVGRILLRTATSMTTIVGDKISPEPQQLPIVIQ